MSQELRFGYQGKERKHLADKLKEKRKKRDDLKKASEQSSTSPTDGISNFLGVVNEKISLFPAGSKSLLKKSQQAQAESKEILEESQRIAKTRKESILEHHNINSYDELRSRHVNNPLFKKDRKVEIPPGYVPVLHFTNEEMLDRIGNVGLMPVGKNDPKRIEVDRVFDEVAKGIRPGFSRSKSVYAYIQKTGPKLIDPGGWPTGTAIIITLYVDPKNVLVADAENVNRAREISNPESRAESYWEDSIFLSEYLALPEKEKRYNYQKDDKLEVIIPDGVPVEHMEIQTGYDKRFGMDNALYHRWKANR